METTFAIQTEQLSKSFAELKAVNNVRLEIKKGEMFSLLGPNGAGKSTTIAMLTGLLVPDMGEARIMGHSITQAAQKAKTCIGYVPQEIALYEDLSARENLMFWGKILGLRGSDVKRRTDETLEMVGLTDRQKDHIKTYSGGMKRRINIAAALLHKPQILIMDEPTVGIDPQSRRNILDTIKQLNTEGMTILYTTHYMEEAQELSDRIAIMDHGQIIALGTHAELVRLAGEMEKITIKLSQSSDELKKTWRDIPGTQSVTFENGIVNMLTRDSSRLLPTLVENARDTHTRILSIDIQEPNLEAVFLHLTGRALRD